MKNLILSLTLLPIVLAGCASIDQSQPPTAMANPEQPLAKVVIYRQSSLQGSMAKAYIGVEENYFSKLDQNQYIEFPIQPGFHTFKTRAHGSVSSSSKIKAMPGETLCIEARPNVEELEWLVIPFMNALIPSFILEETSCPSLNNLTAI